MLPLKDENPHPPGFKPRLTIALIIVNVIVFFAEVAVTGQFFEFSNRQAMNMFLNWGAVPGCITGQISGIDTGVNIVGCPAIPELSLLTSTFMHGGLLHLGGNMLFLWIFGDNIEARFGKIKYLGIYLSWGIGAGLIHVMGDPGSGIPAVGASGAIMGVLVSFGMFFPESRLMLIFLPVPIKAKYFIPGIILLDLISATTGVSIFSPSNTAYVAHLGGAFTGFLIMYYWKKNQFNQNRWF